MDFAGIFHGGVAFAQKGRKFADFNPPTIPFDYGNFGF